MEPGTVVEKNSSVLNLFKLIQFNKISDLTDLLRTGQDEIDLIGMRDARNFTLLSFACYKNHEECFMLIFNHALAENLRSSIHFEEK